MSANRKKTLFIALGSLLASSTAVAVLTFQTGDGVDSNAATSGSTPQILAEQVAEHVDVAGHTGDTLALLSPPSGYSDAFTPPAGDNEAPAGAESTEDTSVDSYSTPADGVEQPQAAAAPSSVDNGSGMAENFFSLDRPQLMAFGGGGNLPGLQSPLQPGSSTPEDPLTDFDPLLPPDSTSNRPDPISGTGPQDGACDAFTGCGSLDDPPASNPGNESPNGEPPVVTPVPEPGSMGLLALSVALAGFMGRRRRAPI